MVLAQGDSSEVVEEDSSVDVVDLDEIERLVLLIMLMKIEVVEVIYRLLDGVVVDKSKWLVEVCVANCVGVESGEFKSSFD